MIQIYREGDTHEVRGTKCELLNITVQELDHYLNEGWVKDPSEIGNDLPEISESKVDEPKEEQPEEINPVRLKAKEAGIEGWDTKRIKTLEKLLDVNED